jgi:hypothetical protein
LFSPFEVTKIINFDVRLGSLSLEPKPCLYARLTEPAKVIIEILPLATPSWCTEVELYLHL